MKDIRKTIDAVEVEGPSDAMSDAIRDAVLADLGPVKSRSVRARAGLVAAIAVAAGLAAVVSYGAVGIEHMSSNVGAVLVLGGAALIAVLGLSASFGQHRLGGIQKGVLAGLLVVGWALYLAQHSTGAVVEVDGMAWGCAARSVAAGMLAGFGMMWVWRRADPWSPRVTGALIGAASGCIATAGVSVACTAQHAGHLMLGHWLAVPLLALAGTLVARRTLAP